MNKVMTAEQWIVSIWAESLYQKEIAYIFTNLLNEDYKKLTEIKKDFAQWVDDNTDYLDSIRNENRFYPL